MNNIKMHNPFSNLFKTDEFRKEYQSLLKLEKETSRRFDLNWEGRYPCLNEKTENTFFDAHYIYHTAWAARVLKETNPEIHVDISSALYFNVIVSAFMNIRFYDYRPANVKLDNLHCDKADLLSLPFADNSVASLSCMHTVEHVGLGRYGDTLDYDGDIKAMEELNRVLAKEGNLLFVVPICGRPRIQFNAHRIYSYRQIIENFSGLKLIKYSLIPDNGIEAGIIENATEELSNQQKYGCGCFWFKK